MLEISIPGRGRYELKDLVLDLNGTMAVDGEVTEGVEEKLKMLSKLLSISVVTADTHGSAWRFDESLKIKAQRIEEGKEDVQKLTLVQQLGRENTVSIGNGSNDALMLKEAALGICVLGKEGTSIDALMNCDVVVSNINIALELLLHPDRLVATLRK